MTDIEYFGDDDTRGVHHGETYGQGAGAAGAGPAKFGAAVNWAGAIVSLGLVVGMAIWAYQLTMRDVSGVPVIRALEGPMRVAPADPGGTQAEHQGLAVNRIAEGAEAAPAADRVVLAPPPVDLEQVAFTSTSVAAGAATTPTAQPTPAEVSAGTQALIERLIERAEPLAAPAPGAARAVAPVPPVPAAAPAADGAAQIIPASVPGVARSLRPATRPASVSARSSVAAPAPAGDAAVRDIDAAGLPEGTRLVQLGAFDSPEIARVAWDRLTVQFPDYFAGRARVIQQASAGGEPFYRLRAHGFDDLAASRRFCAALTAQSAPCIPVTVR